MQDGREATGPNQGLPDVLEPGKQTREILRLPTWTEALDLIRKELEMILDRDVLPATIPEFPTVSSMTLRMNNPMLVKSAQIIEVVEGQQRAFTHDWDPLFIGYSAAMYINTSEFKKIYSWRLRQVIGRIDASENRCARGQESA